MDVSSVLDDLNKEQREAVSSNAPHALVLAGAGSGKTRVLIHRIAWLYQVEQVTPYHIVAVTFTNKAARAMRSRAETLLDGSSLSGIWLGTFHGLCHRLLRQHWQAAGLTQSFQVIDAQDQRRIIKRLIAKLNIDESKWPAKQVQWFINSQKDEGVRATSIQDNGDYTLRNMIRIYSAYEKVCQDSGLVDFAELLLRSVELLRDNDELRAHYQARFHSILVDEFQDTNALQYAWLQTLAGDKASVFAVGDDDQSIYSWRGAKVENMQKFTHDFPQTAIYKLERNYRSSSIILSAANKVIENNPGWMGKILRTDKEKGQPILVLEAFNERDEASGIVQQIEEWLEQGKAHDEIAVLYRSNAQSRVIEGVLLRQNIPYRVYGGARFFERAVIKDALAYLRLVRNHDDDQSFERIVNVPPRGIGNKTLAQIREMATKYDSSLWITGQRMLEEKLLPQRALKALSDFYQLIKELYDDHEKALAEQAEAVITATGLKDYYGRGNTEEAQSNVENLEEFIVTASDFEQMLSRDEELLPVDAFLAHTSLESDAGRKMAEDVKYVQLMTLHSAKGLEFPCVVMAGMEEGLFPHAMALEEPGRLEEERRLCYVGITRAEEELMMTYAETRRLYYGHETQNVQSRFLREIPVEFIHELRPRRQPRRSFNRRISPMQDAQNDDGGIHVGQRVRHGKFGEGMVLAKEGSGDNLRVQVNFSSSGTKWLVTNYAGLVKL